MKKSREDTVDVIYNETIVLDSYDGAEHRNIKKSKTSIVSFSSQILTTKSISSGLLTVMQENILTWQQTIGSETASNMLSILKPTFKERT